MAKYHKRRRESKLFHLRQIIGDLSVAIAKAKIEEETESVNRLQRKLDRIFRYATAIGMDIYEVTVKCTHEYTTKVCVYSENDAMYDAVHQIFQANPKLGIREQKQLSCKKIQDGVRPKSV